MTLPPLSSELVAAVDRRFIPSDRQQVQDSLASLPADMRNDVVILAYGDLARFTELVQTARLDYRDVRIQLDEREGGLPTVELVRRCRELGLPVPFPWDGTLPERFDENVRRFVADELIIPFEKVKASDRLREDLGVTAERGLQLMQAFGRQYQVDVSGLQVRDFESAEQWNLFDALVQRLFGRRKRRLNPVTVGDLAAAAYEAARQRYDGSWR